MKPISRFSSDRRRFVLQLGKYAALAAAFAAAKPFAIAGALAAEKKGAEKKGAAKVEPLPPGKTEVPPTDAVAKAVGYVSDASTVDKSKRKDPKAKCSNCALYAPVNGSWGQCQMLTNGLVSANGWCASWSKKS